MHTTWYQVPVPNTPSTRSLLVSFLVPLCNDTPGMNIGFIRICPKQLYRPTVSRIDVCEGDDRNYFSFPYQESWKVKSNQSFW